MNHAAEPARVTLEHPEGRVHLDDLGDGRMHVSVEVFDSEVFVPHDSCETAYPVELVSAILAVKSPAWLCYSLQREESPLTVEVVLRQAILSFVGEEELGGKRLLDFGCGSGASTMVLKRLLPDTVIVGIDIAPEQLAIARDRAEHYGLKDVEFVLSPRADGLPAGIGTFDAILFSAVFEHMLPDERNDLLPRIWALLRPGGILFLNQTPHRWYPLEHHTTGLPFVNYLSDRLALRVARRFSKRVSVDATWEQLLRDGIRGGTERQILRILRAAGEGEPVTLRPTRLGIRDSVDIWYAYSTARNPRPLKRAMRAAFKGLSRLTGEGFAPDLNLALRKSG